MVGKRQPAGACDHRVQGQISQLFLPLLKKLRQGFLYICKMPFIVGKKNVVRFIQYGDLDRRGTDIDPETVRPSAFGKGSFRAAHKFHYLPFFLLNVFSTNCYIIRHG